MEAHVRRRDARSTLTARDALKRNLTVAKNDDLRDCLSCAHLLGKYERIGRKCSKSGRSPRKACELWESGDPWICPKCGWDASPHDETDGRVTYRNQHTIFNGDYCVVYWDEEWECSNCGTIFTFENGNC